MQCKSCKADTIVSFRLLTSVIRNEWWCLKGADLGFQSANYTVLIPSGAVILNIHNVHLLHDNNKNKTKQKSVSGRLRCKSPLAKFITRAHPRVEATALWDHYRSHFQTNLNTSCLNANFSLSTSREPQQKWYVFTQDWHTYWKHLSTSPCLCR